MPRLAPSIAAVRVAVRRSLVVTPGLSASDAAPRPGAVADSAGSAASDAAARPGAVAVLVACSGGPDSLALAAAARFVAPRLGLRVGLVTVDHGLQPGSAERAAEVAGWARDAGFEPVRTVRVEVAGRRGGPEAAARQARYCALVDVARSVGAAAVLLGHTREDQAETVLLALARGAGPRGMAGMPSSRIIGGVTFLRPLLDVARADTYAACEAAGLQPWQDPHNTDPRYARARVRAALPMLIEALGSGVVGNLARSAALLAADTAALDALAELAAVDAADPAEPAGPADPAGAVRAGGLRVEVLAALPDAVRTRVLHRWVRGLGVPGSALSARHIDALDALVTGWRGQGPVALPGGVPVSRRDGRLVVGTPAHVGDPGPGGNRRS